MVAAAAAYGSAHKGPGDVNAILHGVSAAAVGMVLYVTVQLGIKTVRGLGDVIFVVVTVFAVSYLHQPILLVLAVVGFIATFCFRPRGGGTGEGGE